MTGLARGNGRGRRIDPFSDLTPEELGIAAEPAGEEAAVDFLEKLRPGGPWTLTAIVPDGLTTTITARTASEVREFVRAHNGKCNLYYAVNPLRTAMSSKAAKTDVAAIEFVFGDFDPSDGETPEQAKKRYHAALKNEPEPSALIDSGNGLQGLWRLKTRIALPPPIEGELSPEAAATTANVEARTKALMERVGAEAGTQNIDRVLRLPGTTNLPNKKKREDGRVPCQARLLAFNDAAYPLDAFPAQQAPGRGKATAKPNTRQAQASRIDFDNLPDVDSAALPVSDEIKEAIDTDGSELGGGDRSKAVFRVACELVRAGCSDQQIASVLDSKPIGAHCHDQPDPERAISRAISRARQKADAANEFDLVGDRVVSELNKMHAFVLVGGKSAILWETEEEPGGYTLISPLAFDHWYANRYVSRNGKRITVSKYWMAHPERRQYEGMVFAPNRRDLPGRYNLWRGFAVEARPGNCSKFLAHILDNICQGDRVLYDWVIAWFAQIVQQPAEKLGTALVLRGKEGTGKSIVGKTFGSLLGRHYMPVAKPELVTGRFNGHLAHCLLLQAEEAFWAGDRTAAGALKDLITNDDRVIEFKGLEPIRMRNYVRLFATSNEDWVVPAGLTARRFAVLDVGEARMNDKHYFKAIAHELDNGGREALLHNLQQFDLSEADLRSVPKTKALYEQKLHSLDGEQGWWFEMLMNGKLPWGCDIARCCPAQGLIDWYLDHASRTGIKRRGIATQVGMFLSKQVPGLRKRKGAYKVRRYGNGADIEPRGSVYEFPPLAECRAAFEGMMQQRVEWSEQDDWQIEGRDSAAADFTDIRAADDLFA